MKRLDVWPVLFWICAAVLLGALGAAVAAGSGAALVAVALVVGIVIFSAVSDGKKN